MSPGSEDRESHGTDARVRRCSCSFPGIGLVCALVSTIFFSLSSLFVKLLSDLHPLELVCALPPIIYKNLPLVPKDTPARLYLLGRGIFGAVALCMQFYAFHHIPLGDATTVIFSSPIFIAFFAWLILKEAYGWFNFAVTLTTLAGVVLISKPSFIFGSAVAVPNTSEHLLGTLSAFGGAVFSALALVMIRKLGKAVHFFVHITYLSVFGMILTFVLLMALGEFKTPPCGSDRFYLIALGLCGVGGQTFLTKAFQLEKAAPVAIVRTMDIVFAFTWQFVFLGELPAWLSVGGAVLVMSSAIAIAVKKWLLERQKQ
ncbi:hypothetical protein Bbelb_012050 [Branchiostoma belcheri]|nr:hypothetical protein Bbelb_012050 [Branchiostoma belcheri]